MAISTGLNRFIQAIEGGGRARHPQDVEYTPEERQRARAAVNAQTQSSLRANPSAALAGGAGWQDFEQYHQYQRALREGRGGKHKVGVFEGGGDLNQRPLTGSGATRLVTSSGRAPSAPRRMAQPSATPRAAVSGGIMDAFMDPTTGGFGSWAADGTPRRALQELAMRQLRAATEQGEQGVRRGQATLDYETPGGRFESPYTMRRAAEARQIESDASWQQAQDANDQWWRFTDPQEQHSQGRVIERLQTQALPAQTAAESRRDVAGINQETQNFRAQMALLQTALNALQRGETGTTGYNQPRADQLGSQFDQTLRGAQGVMPQGSGSTAPAAGPPDGGPARRVDRNGRAIVWDPDEQDWFYE